MNCVLLCARGDVRKIHDVKSLVVLCVNYLSLLYGEMTYQFSDDDRYHVIIMSMRRG